MTRYASAPMRPPRPAFEWILRIAAAVGLGISAVLLYMYLRPDSGLCGEGGGCDVIRNTRYASAIGIPTPGLGVGFFLAALALSFVRDPRARPLLAVWGAGGALVSGALLYLQAFEIGAWCQFCVIADVAALVVAVSAFLLVTAPRSRFNPLVLPAVAATAAIAFFTPLVVKGAVERKLPGPSVVVEEKLPEAIAREQRPGVATVVEYLDFECPYCRKLHERLERVLPAYGERVRVVRKMMPLAMHVYAEQAAHAYACADDVGSGAELADALMRADSLTVQAIEAMAAKLGLDLDDFRACLKDPRTAERVRDEMEEARAAGVRGLPTFWIGKKRFTGLADEPQLRSAIDSAFKDR